MSIVTPVGQVIHTGDWKIDHTPVNERLMEFNKLAKFGEEGVTFNTPIPATICEALKKTENGREKI
jgi:hypothetical protein